MSIQENTIHTVNRVEITIAVHDPLVETIQGDQRFASARRGGGRWEMGGWEWERGSKNEDDMR